MRSWLTSFLHFAILFLLGAGGWWSSVDAQPGTVHSHQKISNQDGGFTGPLADASSWASAVCAIGDFDADGVPDIVVASSGDDEGGPNRGAVWLLLLNADGTVKAHQKINDIHGGFGGHLDDGDGFGTGVSAIGDLDGDAVTDLAVGAFYDDDGGFNKGAVWILFLNADGTVKAEQKISEGNGGFTGTFYQDQRFGSSVAELGDVDGDGVVDIAVGTHTDADGGQWRGAVWILFLNSNGTVKGHSKISSTQGGFGAGLGNQDFLGIGVAGIGDLDGDGTPDLAAGAYGDDDGGVDRGAIWIVFLNPDGTVKNRQKISSTQGGFSGALDNGDLWGISVASVGDLNCDGVNDVVAGTVRDDDGGTDRGAVYILFLTQMGTVSSYQKISDTAGGFEGVIDHEQLFGRSIALVGDIDGDNSTDVVVGAPWDPGPTVKRGATWVLFLRSCGVVQTKSTTWGQLKALLGE